MDPSQPAQPPKDAAYSVADNPADQTSQEEAAARYRAGNDAGRQVDAREHGDMPVPSTHGGSAVPTSLGRGTRTGQGDKPGGEMGLPNTEAEQMRPYGEGEVASAQHNKTGFGEQEDLVSGLDRKKAEQAEAREHVKEMRASGVDVGKG